ncbi:MAG: DUF4387 family protein [Clostridia bacterium]|nr:DUF4387 family protein [Clostridia bacterium]
MKLIDYTKILRSKNAGPLYITFDLIFDDMDKMNYVLNNLKIKDVAKVYGVDEKHITVIPYAIVKSIKITFPRKYVSGSVFDDDVYGCQQHMPLANLEI